MNNRPNRSFNKRLHLLFTITIFSIAHVFAVNNAIFLPSPTITASTATGSIFACAGMASASPNIQQFTVSGVNLLVDITATAPTGFEVSLIPGSGYGGSVTLHQSGGTVSIAVLYVRSAAMAAGNLSGNVVLASAGAISQNVSVIGIVYASPVVNAVANQNLI